MLHGRIGGMVAFPFSRRGMSPSYFKPSHPLQPPFTQNIATFTLRNEIIKKDYGIAFRALLYAFQALKHPPQFVPRVSCRRCREADKFTTRERDLIFSTLGRIADRCVNGVCFLGNAILKGVVRRDIRRSFVMRDRTRWI